MDDLLDHIQDQINALEAWLTELGRACPDDSNVIPVFDYSPELAAAMAVHGIEDPDKAWFVFFDRIEDLMDVRAEIEHSDYEAS